MTFRNVPLGFALTNLCSEALREIFLGISLVQSEDHPRSTGLAVLCSLLYVDARLDTGHRSRRLLVGFGATA